MNEPEPEEKRRKRVKAAKVADGEEAKNGAEHGKQRKAKAPDEARTEGKKSKRARPVPGAGDAPRPKKIKKKADEPLPAALQGTAAAEEPDAAPRQPSTNGNNAAGMRQYMLCALQNHITLTFNHERSALQCDSLEN